MFFDPMIIDFAQEDSKPTVQYVDPYSRRPGGGFERSKESYFTQPPKHEEEEEKEKPIDEDKLDSDQMNEQDQITPQKPQDKTKK